MADVNRFVWRPRGGYLDRFRSPPSRGSFCPVGINYTPRPTLDLPFFCGTSRRGEVPLTSETLRAAMAGLKVESYISYLERKANEGLT
jgi:hypothetical protein